MISQLTSLLQEATTSATPVAEQSTTSSTKGLLAIGAGIAAIGVMGAGLGQGIAAAKAVEAVGRNPEAESKIRLMLIIGAGIAETTAIYALLIAFLILFV
ncbi:ATP synthase F0 subunit C [Mycoplasmopsis cynos]|uniref:ATP synthase subunit c n=2 Tax=Mycoplasmopsis cynos TaxID=171284 RepID=L0RVD9_MYCC1|nr:ATP synthase F0 subunit C [Mycoplasmopsis cynos]MCU9933404.1 ATP synthase F0 subunit C [Mycoplasmopsis cynos]MCU9934891.1 ATP synthase F0 subunit C [Mycoplasmopsis cynos]TQC54885.1 ATP synthase F0 subunit C [Mycoplasmopsis cynos]UWV80896.1 ATP synthase F0 subunit C [Mycoplasmopsis cynos]UWV85935.1 ATP synthase F0 subunit C [Mycoplasmopsis cynos]